MPPPSIPPTPQCIPDWRNYALAWLREHLGEAAPSELGEPALLERSPLESEGAILAFPFHADLGGNGEEDYCVVVGCTEPNYYPAYGLSPAETLDLHLGTRFMLVLSVAQRPATNDGYNPELDARSIVDRVAPDKPIEGLMVVASFEVGEQVHVVLRCRVAGQPVYIMGRDAPLGFCERTDLPPQVAYRLHLGQVLRREPRPSEEG